MLSRKLLSSSQTSSGGGGGGGGGTGAWYGNTSTGTDALSSRVPGPVNVYYRRSILAWVYLKSELSGFGLSSNDVITKIRWYVHELPAQDRMPLPNYAIRMMHVSSTSNVINPTNLGSVSSSNVTDVKAQHNYNAYTPGTGHQEITFDNSFTWNGNDAIGFILAWGQCPTNYSSSGRTRQLVSGRMWYNWSDSAGTYLVSGTAGTTQNYRPAIDLFAT
tara:strand:+ start:1356 stop:2009 length:654 start_codon:yes stop_codon:yes gene_type:complete